MSDINALFLTKYDRKGASSRYRSLQYFSHFEREGIRCTYEPLFPDAYLETLYEEGRKPISSVVRSYVRRLWTLLKIRKYEIIIIEKEILPYTPALFERVLGRINTPYIVDYDDAIFHNYDLSDNPVIRNTLSQKIDVVMQKADAVVAGNEYLASRAQNAGAKRIEIVPTVINLDLYPHVPPEGDGSFTIGWIGSPDTVRYIDLVVDPLERVCEETGATVTLIGSGPVEYDDLPLTVIEWSEETEVDSLTSIDVGIMPLLDGRWQRGKCGFKLIQYMACGKPVVASPVGANTSIVEEGVQGYFASANDEWVTQLKRIEQDRDHARQLGTNGRQRVKDNYCLSATVPYWCGLVKSIVET